MRDKPTSSTLPGERKHGHSTPGQETIGALSEDRRSRSKLDQCQVEEAIIGMLLNVPTLMHNAGRRTAASRAAS